MKHPKYRSLLFLVLVLMAALVISSCGSSDAGKNEGAAQAGDTAAKPAEIIELTYSGQTTAPNGYAVAAQAWIDYVHKELNGRVKITPYWGESLISGKENYAELVSGTADIAHCTVVSEKGYEIMTMLPIFMYNSPSPEVSSDVSREILATFPEYQQEFKDSLVLGFTNAQTYYLISRKPVKSLSDLKGMTVSATLDTEPVFKQFGASVVKMLPGEQYSALEKGIIDATFLPLETLKAFMFAEVAKCVNMDVVMPSAAKPAQFMNLNSYAKLPKDIQEFFVKSSDYWQDALLENAKNVNQAGVDLAKENGVEFTNLSKEDIAKWRAAFDAVAREKAKQLDDIGKPGTKILDEVNRLIKERS